MRGLVFNALSVKKKSVIIQLLQAKEGFNMSIIKLLSCWRLNGKSRGIITHRMNASECLKKELVI